MGKPQFMMTVLLLVALLAACAPQIAPATAPQAPATAAPAKPGGSAPSPPAKAAWQLEWDKVLEGAKKEGTVLAYADNAELRPTWSAAMERYGVQVEIIVARAAELAQKIFTERRAGIYSGDVYMGSSTTPVTVLKPAGVLEPMDAAFILPEVKDPKLWFGERLPFYDKEHTFFGYFIFVQPALPTNTDLVKTGDIKSYKDLLDPRWRGKIGVMDPVRGGSGGKFVTVVSEIMGWDYFRKLVENKPVIFKDDRQMLDWLSHGKVAVTLSVMSTEFTAFRKIGAPIAAVIPEEGSWVTAGSGSAGLISKAAHPNAARVFLNWLLSKEGQMATSKAAGFQSARLDVPTDFLDPMFVVDPSKKHFLVDSEEFLLSTPGKFKIATDVFKDLMK